MTTAVRYHPRRRLAARSVQRPFEAVLRQRYRTRSSSRLAQNQWVNAGFGKLWGFGSAETSPTSWRRSPNPSEYARPLRGGWFSRFRNPAFDHIAPDRIPPVYGDGVNSPPSIPAEVVRHHPLQYDMLRQWATGDFIDDYDRTRLPLRRSTTSRSPRSPGSRRAREHDRRPLPPRLRDDPTWP